MTGQPPLAPLSRQGLAHPRRAMRALRDVRGAGPGLRALLVRFAVTDAVETIPLALLGRVPFRPTRLPVPAERRYRVLWEVLLFAT